MTISISIVIPTRNRSHLLGRAIDSIVAQNFSGIELIIVDDGSDPEHQKKNEVLAREAGDRVRYIFLPQRFNGVGGGPGTARNAGVNASNGAIVGFLDDDDEWMQAGFLPTVAELFLAHEELDFLIADQKTVFQGICLREHYQPQLRARLPECKHLGGGAYEITRADAFTADLWMAQLNSCMFRRGFYQRLEGSNERLHYAEDRDLYVRALDQARKVCYLDLVVAVHHRGDRSLGMNLSSIPLVKQTSTAIGVANELIRNCESREAREFARRWAASDARDLARAIDKEFGPARAAIWARLAFAYRPSLKWGLYAVWLSICAALAR